MTYVGKGDMIPYFTAFAKQIKCPMRIFRAQEKGQNSIFRSKFNFSTKIWFFGLKRPLWVRHLIWTRQHGQLWLAHLHNCLRLLAKKPHSEQTSLFASSASIPLSLLVWNFCSNSFEDPGVSPQLLLVRIEILSRPKNDHSLGWSGKSGFPLSEKHEFEFSFNIPWPWFKALNNSWNCMGKCVVSSACSNSPFGVRKLAAACKLGDSCLVNKSGQDLEVEGDSSCNVGSFDIHWWPYVCCKRVI